MVLIWLFVVVVYLMAPAAQSPRKIVLRHHVVAEGKPMWVSEHVLIDNPTVNIDRQAATHDRIVVLWFARTRSSGPY